MGVVKKLHAGPEATSIPRKIVSRIVGVGPRFWTLSLRRFLAENSVYGLMKPSLLTAVLSLMCWSRLCAASPAENDLQKAIDEAIRSGGGEVRIPVGTIIIEAGLRIKNAKNLRIIGEDRFSSILRLPPAAFAETAEPTPVGATTIRLRRQQRLLPEMPLRIEAEGEIDSFTKARKPYQPAKVKSVLATELHLEEPLAFPVPEGTLIRDRAAPNLFEVSGKSDGVRIENLTIDGGRAEGDPHIRGHAELCGIFVQGKYSYELGPTETRPTHIIVSRCTIRNCHGRGVAFYAVEDSEVNYCEISDTTDEAVDLDHFTVRTSVYENEIRRCSEGMELNDASDCVVRDNRFIGCVVGINVWQFVKLEGWNENNVIQGNRFEGTRKQPLQIQKHLTKNSVSNNTIVP